MNISARDKKIMLIMVPVALVLAYWFLLLAPKREAAATAQATFETVQAQLAEAEGQANTVQAAKSNFARDYATVVALGKAIPTSVDMPSLLVQLEQAAHGTGIKLDGVTTGERSTAAAPAGETGVPGAPDPAAPAAEGAAPSGEPPASAPGAAAASAQGAADAASAAPPAADGSQPADVGEPTAPSAPALESVSLEFKFTGSFFGLADFFHRLKRFVYVNGERVRVRGRLLTIDSVAYEASPDTFPALVANVNATVFLSPKAQGATAGATPTGPAPTAAAPVPVSSADSGSSSPPATPAATATP